MDKSWNILKITDKIDLKVILFYMDMFSIQHMNLHTQIRVRHVTNPY